jgi:hypothetical protein
MGKNEKEHCNFFFEFFDSSNPSLPTPQYVTPPSHHVHYGKPLPFILTYRSSVPTKMSSSTGLADFFVYFSFQFFQVEVGVVCWGVAILAN